MNRIRNEDEDVRATEQVRCFGGETRVRRFGHVQRRNSESVSKKDAEVGTGEAGRLEDDKRDLCIYLVKENVTLVIVRDEDAEDRPWMETRDWLQHLNGAAKWGRR